MLLVDPVNWLSNGPAVAGF